MEQGWQTVEIDGRRFAVRRIAAAGGAALEVERAPDDPVRLRPWQLGDHLDALDRHAHHDGHAPRLDPDGLAAEVLARTSDPPLDAASASELAPLGLWWASGGDRGPQAPIPALRPWSSLARARAQDACTEPASGRLRVGSYLRAMIAASTGDVASDALPGADGLALLDAVTRVNAPAEDMSEGPGSQSLARQTLRLCRALGWTPGQVWAAPALEVDRLLALLDRLEAPPAPAPAPAPAPRRGGLAAYPDAVIIEVGEG